jgi:hypothetical protein
MWRRARRSTQPLGGAVRITETAALIAEFKRRHRALLRATATAVALFALSVVLHFVFTERPHPATLAFFLASIGVMVAVGLKDVSRCPRCDANYHREWENWFNPSACKECGQPFGETPPNTSLERTREG